MLTSSDDTSVKISENVVLVFHYHFARLSGCCKDIQGENEHTKYFAKKLPLYCGALYIDANESLVRTCSLSENSLLQT